MKTRLTTLTLLLAVPTAAALLACGDDDDDMGGDLVLTADAAPGQTDPDAATDTDAGVSTYAAHSLQRSCGPTDGPGIAIKLSSAIDPRTCGPDFAGATLLVELYVAGEDIDAPATFDLENVGAEGAIWVCPGDMGDCITQGVTATIRFDTFVENESATGHVTITGEDIELASEDFQATWCEPENGPVICG